MDNKLHQDFCVTDSYSYKFVQFFAEDDWISHSVYIVAHFVSFAVVSVFKPSKFVWVLTIFEEWKTHS